MTASVERANADPSFIDASSAIASTPGRLWAWIDAFLAPQADRLGADEMRRARLAIVVCGSIALITSVATTNLLLHGVLGNVPISLGILIMVVLIPWLLRLTGSLALAGNAIAAVLAVALAALKFNTGAVSVPPFILLPGVPLLAALIAGPWAGVTWGALSFLELGLFYFLVAQGLEPSIDLDPQHLFRGRYVGSAMMVVFVVLLAQGYERLKNRALDELREARRLAEERSRELEKTRRQQLELKDRFLSHVSHELRTPLSALHQFLSLVLDGVVGDLGKEQHEYLSVAFRNAEQLRRMIDDLMDLNRARDGKLRVEADLICVGQVLLETLRGIESRAAEKQIHLEKNISEELPVVLGDTTRVRQVLGNLVENAIKFTPEEGRIEVSAEADPENDGFLRVSVRDTGCGIDSDALDRIFERLHQEQSNEADSRLGLGLGLAIAKELVQRQGGRIWVESSPGSGSTFHFTLPIFSLSRSLRACVVEDGRLLEAFGVVCVDLRAESSGSTDGLRRGVLHVLRSTVFYPEKDAVLPPGAVTDQPDRFVVLAATDADGMESLVKRLRLRLERFAEERGREAEMFHVEAHTEQVPSELAERPRDEALDILAGRVEAILCGAEDERREET